MYVYILCIWIMNSMELESAWVELIFMHKDGAYDVSYRSIFHELDDDFVANQPVIDDVKMPIGWKQFDNILARLVFHFYI